ncbi:syntaxin [Theileria orientalis]|uniref:Syntaxin n=1 Tax=Theileria orientalis TaxID=68886 RepID=A0A976QVZ0_THEOR|nr:syntaxin [Theileria orientalis]
MLKSLVFHRNLTHSYQNIRHKEKEKAHRFDIANLDAPLLGKNTDLNGNDGSNSNNVVRLDVIPDWIELVDECNFLLSSVRDKVKELEKAQNMNILDVFGKKSRNEYEKIANLSKDISSIFKKIEMNMELISRDVDDYVEHRLRSNAKAKIASELIPLSFTFRKIQKSFYDSLQNDSHNSYTKPDINVNNNLVTDELVQDSVQISHENIADRTMRLQQIALTVQDLKDMYTQLSTMLVEQGSMLDQIDYNVREFSRNSHKFAQELKLRNERDNPKKAVKTVRYLVSVIFVELLLVIIKFA